MARSKQKKQQQLLQKSRLIYRPQGQASAYVDELIHRIQSGRIKSSRSQSAFVKQKFVGRKLLGSLNQILNYSTQRATAREENLILSEPPAAIGEVVLEPAQSGFRRVSSAHFALKINSKDIDFSRSTEEHPAPSGISELDLASLSAAVRASRYEATQRARDVARLAPSGVTRPCEGFPDIEGVSECAEESTPRGTLDTLTESHRTLLQSLWKAENFSLQDFEHELSEAMPANKSPVGSGNSAEMASEAFQAGGVVQSIETESASDQAATNGGTAKVKKPWSAARKRERRQQKEAAANGQATPRDGQPQPDPVGSQKRQELFLPSVSTDVANGIGTLHISNGVQPQNGTDHPQQPSYGPRNLEALRNIYGAGSLGSSRYAQPSSSQPQNQQNGHQSGNRYNLRSSRERSLPSTGGPAMTGRSTRFNTPDDQKYSQQRFQRYFSATPSDASPSPRAERTKSRSRSLSPNSKLVVPPKVPVASAAYQKQAAQEPHKMTKPQPLLIVADLNGTLLVRDKNKKTKYQPRPGLSDFLAGLFTPRTSNGAQETESSYTRPEHKFMIWTSATPKTTQAIMMTLLTESEKLNTVAVWARDKLDLTSAQYRAKVPVYKKLEAIWRDQSIQRMHPLYKQGERWSQRNTLLVDDSVYKATAQPYNLINIPELTEELLNAELADEKKGKGMPVLRQVASYIHEASMYLDVSSFAKSRPFKIDGPDGDNTQAGVHEGAEERTYRDNDHIHPNCRA